MVSEKTRLETDAGLAGPRWQSEEMLVLHRKWEHVQTEEIVAGSSLRTGMSRSGEARPELAAATSVPSLASSLVHGGDKAAPACT